jgi:hypothetical protein
MTVFASGLVAERRAGNVISFCRPLSFNRQMLGGSFNKQMLTICPTGKTYEAVVHCVTPMEANVRTGRLVISCRRPVAVCLQCCRWKLCGNERAVAEP